MLLSRQRTSETTRGHGAPGSCLCREDWEATGRPFADTWATPMTTTASLEALISYVPALITRRVHGDFGATLAPASERFPAAVLIADLSGFTALTEHLSQHSPAGAEELTSILDNYFGHLVGVVMSHGGDVV